MKTKNINKGFTLIEVLLVITLIGVLLTIGLVSFNTEARFIEVRNDTRRNHIQSLESAVNQYKLQEGSYPTGLDRTYQEICDPAATDCTGFFDLKAFLVPKYLQAIPRDPKDTDNTGGSGYEIAVDESSNTVSIRLKESLREGGVDIKVNDPLPDIETSSTNTPLAATVPNSPPPPTTNCPAGYIPVPGNSIYGTSDFCVMKYEAKTGSSTLAATTQASGLPQVNITQNNAITSCNLNNTGGSTGYGLITNAEWMTIARNIEAQGVNWTGGTVGTGGLWRGHSDGTPANALAASADDNLGYEGTGNASPSIEKRTHTLSNGAVIWDLSGNVWEWTSDTIQGLNKPNTSSGFLWQNWSSISNFGSLSYDLTRPSDPTWDTTTGSNENVGQYYAGTVTGTTTFAFLRGGFWADNIIAGVFTLFLNLTPSASNSNYGFRCVVR
jgi:prepilin-type N-terminal cleavage/methylation domain-containing protein